MFGTDSWSCEFETHALQQGLLCSSAIRFLPPCLFADSSLSSFALTGVVKTDLSNRKKNKQARLVMRTL